MARVFRSFVPEGSRSYSAPKAKRIARRRIYRQSPSAVDRHIFYIPGPDEPSLPGSVKKSARPILALLIAAHNEELVIAKTIQSAIDAGMDPIHTYVVDDNSSDRTSLIARSLIPASNVIKVKRSGKGLALSKAARRFKLAERYRWIHIADADGAFAPNYFRIFRRELRVENTAATGYIKSLPGKRVSEYRVFEYTIGMELHRRVQAFLNVVPVIAGPTSCFRADVFARVNFDNKSLTEDFDVTMQLHRRGLGKIQFIPQAITYTQDPKNLTDYVNQIQRWNRGSLQSMMKYNIGRKATRIDSYLSYQILQNLLFFASYLLWVPYLAITRHTWAFVAAAFVVDVLVTFVLTFLAASRTQRWDIISAFPQVYVLRWVSLGVFLKAFIEVVLLGRYRNQQSIWENHSTRRYIMPASN